MRESAVTPFREQLGQIFVLPHRRVSVITGNPDVHFLPATIALGVGANLSDGLVYDSHRVSDDRRILTLCVRSLVDAGQGDERIPIASSAQAPRCFLADAAIDCQPAADVAAEMSRRRSRHEYRAAADTIARSQSTADHAQRAEIRLRQLEDRRRCRIDVAIHEPHLRADVAPGVSGQSGYSS